MARTTTHRSGGTYAERVHPTGLYEVVDVILDKGLIIDLFLRVSLVGLELVTVDGRIVIASVDTYLRFAEAVERLELGDSPGANLPELLEQWARPTGRGLHSEARSPSKRVHAG
jgi:gas vesicle structural protein